jgi:hypothetical protein
MLTNAAVKAAGARSRACKIFDERGLHPFVAPNGRKSWRMKYQCRGKEQLTLRAASSSAASIRATRRAPSTDNDQEALGTFESAARPWHAMRPPSWSTGMCSPISREGLGKRSGSPGLIRTGDHSINSRTLYR